MASKIQINPISESLEIGTRPHWDSATQSLYFVDLPPSKVYKYHPATKTITSATVGKFSSTTRKKHLNDYVLIKRK